MIQLHVEPKVPAMSWDTFCKTKPAFSIALDGYVYGGPKYDQHGPFATFNHHEDVDRLSTRATCAQVLIAIRQGFFETFKNGSKDKIHVYVNDCDQDVCTAVFLLRHGAFSNTIVNPILNRLVFMEDMLDTTAGAYPFPIQMEILEELAWIFEPYTDFRLSGGLSRRDESEFAGVIERVEKRISDYIVGRGHSIPIKTDYERIGGGPGWALVIEKGAQARTAMFGDGIRAFISVQEMPDGTSRYTIGRMSTFVPFDIPELLAEYNTEEGCVKDCWGGADTIGGSPRVAGSKLKPKRIEEITNKHLALKRSQPRD